MPPEVVGMSARPPTLPRAMSCRANRERVSRDPRRSFDASRRGTDRGGSSSDVRKVMEEDQRRDGNLDVSMAEEGTGESQGGAQALGYGFPPYYPPFP